MCSCKSGFIGNGLNCTRVVFCDTSTCCSPGYTWDATKKLCVDINECLSSSLYTCLTQPECINKIGTYICNPIKNPSCPTSVCSSDEDCVRSGADLSCVDPCTSYQVIDGSQRLYTINSTGRFPTDRYLFGWYRYSNGLTLREGFVGSLKCGSLEPFSLSSHPSISDGVKSVPLLVNGLTSNSTGSSILVKACPAGYYVYKFAGMLKFEVYCTGSTWNPKDMALFAEWRQMIPLTKVQFYSNYINYHLYHSNNDWNSNNNHYYNYSSTNNYTDNNHYDPYYNTNYYNINNNVTYNNHYYSHSSTNNHTNKNHYYNYSSTNNNQCYHYYIYYNTIYYN
ncbi:uromodulin-like [Anomaloglossus baeobatrachus]